MMRVFQEMIDLALVEARNGGSAATLRTLRVDGADIAESKR
jgi:hypothetical protein